MGPNQRLKGSFKPQQRQSRYRTPNQITKNLFIGSAEDAKGVHNLKSLGIGAVLSICEPKYHTRYPSDFKTLRIDAEDNDSQNISKYFKRCCDFIDSCRPVCGVLVHCYAGISRSATVVIAYLMKRHKIPPRSALNWVRENRPECDPNGGFRKQLDRWCDYLESRNQIDKSMVGPERGPQQLNGAKQQSKSPQLKEHNNKPQIKKEFNSDKGLNRRYRGMEDDKKRAVMKLLNQIHGDDYKPRVPQYQIQVAKDDTAAKKELKGKIGNKKYKPEGFKLYPHKRRCRSDPGKKIRRK